MTRFLPAFTLLLAMPGLALAGPFDIAVTGGKEDQANVVCTFTVPIGDTVDVKALKLPDGTVIPAQTGKPSLAQGQAKGQVITFVLPKLPAGKVLMLTLTEPKPAESVMFKYTDMPGKYTDLLYGDRPVLRYINAPRDPANHYETFKPFHHVFDPADGKTLLTSGAYKTAKDGQFPHHRGLFFGWNKCSYDGMTADVWHGTDNVYSQHDSVANQEAGPVYGRQRSTISWHGKDGKTFITEQRELTAYAVPGGTLIDFASVLTTDRKSVKLDGDPQHAGFHFRANMEVATKTAKQSYYLRPDGKGKLGETRNWEPEKADPKKPGEKIMPDPRTINLPWDALSFMLNDKRYTVLRINHPDNPKDARGSERDYGRFGDYFAYEVTPEKPLRVKYRVWVQGGEMTVEACNAASQEFVNPPATLAAVR